MTATESTAVVVDFTALLETLGFTDDEFVAIGHDADGGWRTAVIPPVAAPHYVAKLPETANTYFGVNPTKGPVREDATRGKAVDVTRLAALWCDLDFKSSGCGSLSVARTIIDDLSGLLGTRPTVLVHTGHGIHPYWPVSDGHDDVNQLAALVRRFGRLVAAVAKDRAAKVDNVFDLARMLRVPGTINNKGLV